MQLPYANLQIKHQNKEAKNPLILPVHLICNTSDEQIYANIRENSKNNLNWVKEVEEHDGIAILCGSGPSLADCLDDIKELQNAGGKIFAMNGSAKFLYDNDIMPDYQVMIDAREITADLIGPANYHLFASQVHPECFKRQPDAQLWHLQVGNIENEFPDYEDSYVLIGGAASVGNTATCLAFAMGYRNLQIFGYDSSHRNAMGHAFHQKINDGDPCAVIRFNEKEYVASLTMKLQAERFQDTARALQEYGCKIEVHGSGLLPDMWNTPIEKLTEQEKYTRMWAHDVYRHISPGEDVVGTFLNIVEPSGTIIDYGCGTGRAGLKLSKNFDVILLDFTSNSRDEEAKHLNFHQCDLTEYIQFKGDYGLCTDVMEHIPTEDVEIVIKNIMESSSKVFFQISTIPDVCGEIISQQLHLTVRPHSWWKKLFIKAGFIIEWEECYPSDSQFYVTRKE